MPESDINTIVKEAQHRWNTAFNSGDAAAVAALYTLDGTVLPPAHAAVKGTQWFLENLPAYMELTHGGHD